MDNEPKTTGQKIRQLRQSKGYSQAQLAKLLYVSRQTVSRWEVDFATPTADKLIEMSALFSVSPDYFHYKSSNELDDTEAADFTDQETSPKSKKNLIFPILILTVLLLISVFWIILLGFSIFNSPRGSVETVYTFYFSHLPIVFFVGLIITALCFVGVIIYLIIKNRKK